MQKKYSLPRKALLLILVLVFVLSACQQAPTPAPVEPTAPAAPAEPAAPTPTQPPAPAAPTEPAAPAPTEVPAPVTEERDTVIVAINGQPSRLLPSKSVGRLNEILNSMMFESLTTHDQDNNLVGLLAESYRSVDPTTWEFKLRPGIQFSNGYPLTAEDVKFTYETLILDPEFASPHRTFMQTIEGIDIIDELTFNIRTSQPDVLLPLRVFDIYGSVVSKQHYEEVGGEANYDDSPVGTGPYKLVEWVRDSHILYERNENYWGELPAFRFMEVRFISDDAARVNALLAGEVDVIGPVPPVRVGEIDANPNLEVVVAPSNRVHYLVFDTTQPPFDDERVRMAVSMAIDREALINAVQFGYGTPVPSVFMPETFGYNRDIVPMYDPERAMELLAEAGYPDGFTTEIDSFTGSIVDHTRTAEAVVGFLDEIGIQATLNVAEMTNWGPRRLALETSPIYNYSFGDALFDHGPNLRTFTGGAQGYYYSGDTELNALIDEALAEFDIVERERLYNEIQKQFYEKGILVGLYQMQQIWAVKSDIVYEPQVDEMWRLFRIYER
jgi:peptide/nickel transport system substrate-binding protein